MEIIMKRQQNLEKRRKSVNGQWAWKGFKGSRQSAENSLARSTRNAWCTKV